VPSPAAGGQAASEPAPRGPAPRGTAARGTAARGGGESGRGAGETAGAQGAGGRARPLAGGWPAGRLVAVGIAVMSLFSVAAIVLGALAVAGLGSARREVVTNLDPASFQASQLEVALLNQETGLRGYALTGQASYLAPYHTGLAAQPRAVTRLRQTLGDNPKAEADVTGVLARVADWRASYAIPVMAAVAATGRPPASPGPGRGKADFDAIRAQVNSLQGDISDQRHQALTALSDASDTLNVAFIGIAAGLLLIVILLTAGVNRTTIRPLARLAADARRIADGDFGHQLGGTGPQEVRDLGADVDEMRARIVSELASARSANLSLEQRTQDLQRSNAELEQFAYVASHDLQEPLRKVASFCQLLQRRYGGQLDEKADQYIEYAVDGAKRMQMLINDLLAFSRVGRMEQERVPVAAAQLLAQAEGNLATVIRRTRARIDAGDLPTVSAEPTLLTAVFQNLLSNAIKFRGEQAPVITVRAERNGEFWLFSVRDNGIGVSPEYAERIFVIFQRLHDKATYPGTGIGLAMSRKIIEYHGGRIWLDTTITSGARFYFTLPALPGEPGPAANGDRGTDRVTGKNPATPETGPDGAAAVAAGSPALADGPGIPDETNDPARAESPDRAAVAGDSASAAGQADAGGTEPEDNPDA
jgi:signal transduction histidine kinase